MKKPQFITIGIAVILVAVVYLFGRTVPPRQPAVAQNAAGDHVHTDASALTDTILNLAKSRLSAEQVIRITTLENSISRGAVREQQLSVYHQLAHFWSDSARIFLPYAWYEAEAARLENSEKTLTFAARLFLDNLLQEENPEFRRWEATQAKDLFERSLKINPDNDSARVGIGACYLFGHLSEMPMEGIEKIREVLAKDSTNTYAHMMLARGSVMSGQFDRAISRLETVIRLQPDNLEAILMLADVFERTGNKSAAIKWYKASLGMIKRTDVKAEIEKRIADLGK